MNTEVISGRGQHLLIPISLSLQWTEASEWQRVGSIGMELVTGF